MESKNEVVGLPLPEQEQQGASRQRPQMRNKRGNARRTGQNLVVRGVRRDPPDVHKLARVLADLAADMGEDETDAAGTEGPGPAADQETTRRAA